MAGTGETLSYGDLERRSAQLAHVLHDAGLRPGDVVALVTENNLRAMEVYWAALRSGLYITAVNYRLKPDEVAYIVNDSGAAALVVSAAAGRYRHGDRRCDSRGEAPAGLRRAGPRLRQLRGDHRRRAGDPLDDQPHGATMLYSSGTTGRPKGVRPQLPGVQVSELGEAVVGLAQQAFGIGRDAVYLSPGPIYHAAPLRFCGAVQALGGTVVMMPRFDAEQALAAIAEHRGHARPVRADHVRPDAAAAAGDPGGLRRLQPAGRHPRGRAVPGRGQAEDDRLVGADPGRVLRGHRVQRDDHHRQRHLAEQAGHSRQGRSWARSASATTTAPSSRRPRPGIVYFESETVPFAYHNDPDKTRASQHPQHPSWTTLGDIGYLDEDGFLFLTDRRAFTIISGGVNIYPQETENVLALHPAVYDVAVIGVPDPEMGESVAAFIQPAPGAVPGPELEQEIIAFVKSKIAGFKAPRTVRFVDQLPRSEAGKLMKGQLKARYAEA